MKNILTITGISKIIHLSKREKFVLAVLVLSAGIFIFEFFGANGLYMGLALSVLSDIFLFLILRKDIPGSFFYPILILPFFYTLSFSFFYLLFPSRFVSKIIITVLYAFGLYSLFLTENIFAVSSIRTINLLRSARIVSFILTLVILFFLVNVFFNLHFPIYVIPFLVFGLVFILNFQSLWFYCLDTKQIKEIVLYSLAIGLIIAELSLILTVWPVNGTTYSICIAGLFYAFSGLAHAWFEGRLFKGVLWEYVWVGFLSLMILILFSNWGI